MQIHIDKVSVHARTPPTARSPDRAVGGDCACTLTSTRCVCMLGLRPLLGL